MFYDAPLFSSFRRDLFKNAGFEEIIFTRNATEAINLVARTWGAANIACLVACIVMPMMSDY